MSPRRSDAAGIGYTVEKVVLLNPTDLTTVGPLGDVTHDLLLKMGMNVEMVATDWGTVVQRRVSREPVEKGGWSILHTWAPSTIRFTPVEHSQIRGLGATAWFGWYQDDTMEALTRRFVEASTPKERDETVLEIHRRAFEMVPWSALGTFQIRTAYRSDLTGVIKATVPYLLEHQAVLIDPPPANFRVASVDDDTGSDRRFLL